MVLCSFFNTGNVHAGDDTKLTGSDLKVENAALHSDAIFVGQITDVGAEEEFPPASAYAGPLYHGVKIKIIQVLRGTVGTQTSVTLFVDFVAQEKLQTVGNSYIFFVTKNRDKDPDPFTALKLLPATDDSIAKIKQLIATLGDSMKLPGSNLTIGDALLKSDCNVFVGQAVHLSNPNAIAADEAFYWVQVGVTQVLRGSVDTLISVKVVSKNYESFPEAGNSYIFSYVFFATKSGDVLKLLPATDDNIATVKKLISN